MGSLSHLSFSVIFLAGLLLSFNPVSAKTSQVFLVGLTQTDNLEIPSGSDVSLDNNGSVKRIGLETGAALLKQELSSSGGYNLQASAIYNKSLDGTGDIKTVKLSGSKLTSLNDHWLMRSSAQLKYYDNEPVEINSYNGLQLENTFGYVSDNNSGVDISLKYAKEDHNKAGDNSYKMQRTGLSLRHFFPHELNTPYWAVDTRYTVNNADVENRDYDSIDVGLEYRQWSIAKFSGKVALKWQQSDYDQDARKDNYAMAQLDLTKVIKKNMAFQVSALAGRYDSTALDSSIDFYKVVSRLKWRF